MTAQKSGAFLTFVIDQLVGIDRIDARSMFGGVGLYAHAVFFGIVHRETLYFKVDPDTRPAYESAGMRPFKPFANRPTTLQYYEVPAAVLETSHELTAWARRAIAIAERAGT